MLLPEKVKRKLTEFLSELPVKKFSKDWENVQLAISMLNSPELFKKGVHVYITSKEYALEDRCYDDREMSIRIYPHKLMMRRSHSEYNSYSDVDIKKVFRYIAPSDKYGPYHFDEVMADLSFLFSGNYNDDTSDYDGVRYYGSNFRIESNVDKIKERTKKLK